MAGGGTLPITEDRDYYAWEVQETARGLGDARFPYELSGRQGPTREFPRETAAPYGFADRDRLTGQLRRTTPGRRGDRFDRNEPRGAAYLYGLRGNQGDRFDDDGGQLGRTSPGRQWGQW